MTERPAKCRTCESTEPNKRRVVKTETEYPPYLCDDPWHSQPDASPTACPLCGHCVIHYNVGHSCSKRGCKCTGRAAPSPRESQQEPAPRQFVNYRHEHVDLETVSASSSPSPSAPPEKRWLEGASQWKPEPFGDRGIVQITPEASAPQTEPHAKEFGEMGKHMLSVTQPVDRTVRGDIDEAQTEPSDRARAEQIVADHASVFTVTQHQQLVDAIVQMAAEVRERSEEKK